jgi:hypothetical protein
MINFSDSATLPLRNDLPSRKEDTPAPLAKYRS